MYSSTRVFNGADAETLTPKRSPSTLAGANPQSLKMKRLNYITQ